jgi:TPP-dependent 2-oxoacid decarboxylase
MNLEDVLQKIKSIEESNFEFEKPNLYVIDKAKELVLTLNSFNKKELEVECMVASIRVSFETNSIMINNHGKIIYSINDEIFESESLDFLKDII